MTARSGQIMHGSLTIDVEDWFHILDSPVTPAIEEWDKLPLHAHDNIRILLDLLDETSTKATFFWLGWLAERMPEMVRECVSRGHEVASHGYAHLLAYQVGPTAFLNDVVKAKTVLEGLTGVDVQGFRAPGFGIKHSTKWAFDVIAESGHIYDSSVFPARRAHGGMPGGSGEPYLVPTSNGSLVEVPVSVVSMFGIRLPIFGGGYLRLSPMSLIRHGCKVLARKGRTIVIYVHPREIHPDHPRLPLAPARRFRSYVNLRSTLPKLEWLCRNCRFVPMRELVATLTETTAVPFGGLAQ